MLCMLGRCNGNRGFEVSRDALLDNMLEACKGAHDDIPVLAHNIDTVIDVAAQC